MRNGHMGIISRRSGVREKVRFTFYSYTFLWGIKNASDQGSLD